MKISIITINLNNKSGLQKTADSIVQQTLLDFEWIVIDGGSTDGSKEVIEEYKDYITYYVSEPDKGIYNAMNKGIVKSQGEYLFFLNSGDYLYEKDTIAKVLPLLHDKDFYVADVYTLKGLYAVDISTTEKICNTILFRTFPHQGTFIHRRNFRTYGLYREDKVIISDWCFFFDAVLAGRATVEKWNFTVSVFERSGISSNICKVVQERSDFLGERRNLKYIIDFYLKYHMLVEKVRANRFLRIMGLLYAKKIKKWV